MSKARSEAAKPARRSHIALVPVALFAALAALFYFGLFSGDPSRLPSALIGKTVPEFTLPPVEGLMGEDGKPVQGFSSADLKSGKIAIVNVWASWCVPCQTEHPFLVELVQKSGAPLYGINYKDDPAGARRFLGRLGNPFTRVGADRNGSVGIDWGVYGVPETFIVSGDGKIIHKHVGPIDARSIETKLLPEIARARAK